MLQHDDTYEQKPLDTVESMNPDRHDNATITQTTCPFCGSANAENGSRPVTITMFVPSSWEDGPGYETAYRHESWFVCHDCGECDAEPAEY